MNADDLRISNILKQGKVRSLYYDGTVGLDDGFVHRSEELSGITLTPEWLEKFGFNEESTAETEHHGNFFSRHILDYKYCFAYADFRDDWGLYQEYTDSPHEQDDGKKYFISCGIKYVHQLQNLYFALTNSELELNESIKK